jgi:hypothetical protein
LLFKVGSDPCPTFSSAVRRSKNKKSEPFDSLSDRVGIQTPNLIIRSETLYSVELHSHLDCKSSGFLIYSKKNVT